MTDRQPDPGPIDDTNPFQQMAVADVLGIGTTTVSVPTPAINEAIEQLDGFLTTAPGAARPGNVVAVVGEYGTGKSHLVGELLHHVYVNTDPQQARTVYLEAEQKTFVNLYKRFVEHLEYEDVRDQVRTFYADVLADALQGSDFTAGVADAVRSGGLDPVTAVERLGMMESEHLGELQRMLERVTNNAAFGTALTLLLRPGFTDAAWEWLTGRTPDQILVERGITAAIATEEAALEAMGVFAVLYSYRDRRFVVAIDELNKVVSASRRPSENAVDAFKKMLEVFAGARALLVLSGLPDSLEVLGKDVGQRIGRVIHVSPLNAQNTMDFIRKSQARIGRGEQLQPFDEHSVQYLVKVADGNARRIVRLCHQLYRRALDESSDPAQAAVTEAMIRQVARDQTSLAVGDNVHAEIRQVLNALGLEYTRDSLLNQETNSQADYWIPVGSENSGCVLVLSESVLRGSEAEQLVNRATSIQAAVERVELVLIVVGLVHEDLLEPLTVAFGAGPVVYDRYTFVDTLARELNARVRVLEPEADADPLLSIRERLGRAGRQQANTQRMVDQALVMLNGLRASSERQLTLLRRELSDLAARVRPSEVEQTDTPPPSQLPGEVARLFTSAQRSLEEVDQVDAALWAVFASTEGDLHQAIDARVNVRAPLRAPNFFPAVGVSSLLHRLLNAFRTRVNDWYRAYVPSPSGGLQTQDREQLSAICRAYDAIYEYVPLFRLEGLDEFTPRAIEGDMSVMLPPQRVDHLRKTLTELSNRVQVAVLASVSEDR